jgi:hypothetical protein
MERRAAPGLRFPRARAWGRRTVRRVRCENRFVARYGFNLATVLHHHRHPRPLADLAQDVVETLRRDGVATVDAAALLGGRDLLDRLTAHAEDLVRRQEPAIAYRRQLIEAGATGGLPKPFLVELMGERPRLHPDDPVLEFALHDQVRGVAEAYSRCELRVHDVNLWLNLATPLAPTASQRWHRDLPEDYDIVKCFLYLRDVTAGGGAMQYARRTHTREGRRMQVPQSWDGIGWRIDDAEVECRVPAERMTLATGAAGTLVFADTRGLHKGGHARDRDRLLAQVLFASPACFRPRLLRPAEGWTAADLPDVRLARR